MKYKIEIWRYHHKVETYENEDIKEVLKWYKEEWQYTFDMGECTFYIYENDRRMDFDEEYELGFFD